MHHVRSFWQPRGGCRFACRGRAAGGARSGEVVAFGGYSAGTIVVKTGERRLYLVVDGRAIRYPVGVGKAGKQWAGTSRIDGKYLRPAWSPPAEVKRDKPSLPDVIPGGSPRNPMGVAAMTLAGGEYAIHGTNMPGSIGGFVSYGCIRMYNQDITDLFGRVSVGTTVVVTRVRRQRLAPRRLPSACGAAQLEVARPAGAPSAARAPSWAAYGRNLWRVALGHRQRGAMRMPQPCVPKTVQGERPLSSPSRRSGVVTRAAAAGDSVRRHGFRCRSRSARRAWPRRAPGLGGGREAGFLGAAFRPGLPADSSRRS